MRGAIIDYRKRTGATQQDLANMMHTDKANISHIENDRRNVTLSMYEAGFNSVPDAHLLNDMAYEMTKGYTTPTPSNQVYDDHRMSFKYRIKEEIQEFVDALSSNRLDKRPEYLTPDEKEHISMLVSELQDVLFEGQGFLNKLSEDYEFLKPQTLNQNRDRRLKMQRRI
ncbi:helix-turn-helix transcriptional regulator [Salinicoccus albus]|uniref:helix-turn-helix transcriptional regulator n=1 Tax=Salinicoccus albus TaxID=418756 RepID=UPI00037F81A4|nr:helix-turn-helix transcriptional regulator [Salinicoccus albus]